MTSSENAGIITLFMYLSQFLNPEFKVQKMAIPANSFVTFNSKDIVSYPQGSRLIKTDYEAEGEDIIVKIDYPFNLLWYVPEYKYTLFKHRTTGEYLEVPHKIKGAWDSSKMKGSNK